MDHALVATVLKDTPTMAVVTIKFENAEVCVHVLDFLRRTQDISPFVLEKKIAKYFFHYEKVMATVSWDPTALFNRFGSISIFPKLPMVLGSMTMDFFMDNLAAYIIELCVAHTIVAR